MNQSTLEKSVEIAGIGLHTGARTAVRVEPAPADHGIVFVRADLAERPSIRAAAENVVATERETRLGQGNVSVQTVEHFLAAVGCLGLDNIVVEVSGPEMPALDGSALPYVEALRAGGLKRLGEPRKVFRLREEVWISEGGAHIVALPSTTLRLSYTISFDSPAIGSQYRSVEIDSENPAAFLQEVASARTFSPADDVEALRAAGLARGGSLENAVVFDPSGPRNPGGLRFPDEPVRHKILDLVGDLTLLGVPLRAHVIVIKGGHALHVRLARRLAEMRSKTSAAYHQALDVAEEELDLVAIQKVLPHRYPFLLIDRIIALETGKRVVGLKNVTGTEPHFQGHFPGNPVMPGVLILEAMAQVGGVLLLSTYNLPGRIVFFLGIDAAKFRRPVRPGDQVIFEVVPVKVKSKIAIMHGEAFVEGMKVAEADLKFQLMEE